MSYVKKHIITDNDIIIAKVELSPLRLIIAWILGIFFCWLLFIPTIKAIKISIIFATTEYYITDKKLIEKYGLFNTHCDEMLLHKIENITIRQSLFGKIFNYGDVCAQGANFNNINFLGVKHPNGIKRLISKTLEENK